jgi:hypothetical protein
MVRELFLIRLPGIGTGAEVKIPALSLQKTQGQGRGTLGQQFASAFAMQEKASLFPVL